MSKQRLPKITTRDQMVQLIVNKKQETEKRIRLKQVTLRDLKINEVLDGRVTQREMYQIYDRRWGSGPLGNKTPFADLMENGAWKLSDDMSRGDRPIYPHIFFPPEDGNFIKAEASWEGITDPEAIESGEGFQNDDWKLRRP